MRKFVDALSWGFIAIFAVPTVLIMASWNSLPGQPLYGVKRVFEDVLLLLAKPSYTAEANLHVQYTERRMGEVKVLIANDQSSEGLSQLSQQIRATKAVIERAPNKDVQKQIAERYISTLKNVSDELRVADQRPTSSNAPSVRPRTTGRIYPTYTPYPTTNPNQPVRHNEQPQAPSQPTPAFVPQSPPPTEDNVTAVQEEINNTINELQTLTGSTSNTSSIQEPTVIATPIPEPTATAVPTQVPQQFQEMPGNLKTLESNNSGNGNGNGNNDSGTSGHGNDNPNNSEGQN